MDNIDIKILNALQSNSRASITSIAGDLKISNVATQQRIQKMEKAGVIKGYGVELDMEKLGFKTTAYIGIFLERAKDYKDVLKKMNDISEVREIHFTTGNYSIFAKIQARDNKHLMNVLNEKIQSLDGISRTETFISLDGHVTKTPLVLDSNQ